MPTITHNFRLRFNYRFPDQWGPISLGLVARSLADIDEICAEAEIENNEHRQIEVRLNEEDPRLAKLYAAIEAKYQLKPSRWNTIPAPERQKYFGVKRRVAWTNKEIDQAELLRLESSKMIAEQEDGDEEQLAREDYVVLVDGKQYSKVQLGFLTPFNGLAVAEPLRSEMLQGELAAVHLPPVVFVGGKVKKPLWALKSHVILPQTLNPFFNGLGEVVPPNTEWWSFWEDGGHDPPTLRYKREAVEALAPFDIAMTYERVGPGNARAYRACIVTQKFRAEMKRLKVPALSYVPVVLE